MIIQKERESSLRPLINIDFNCNPEISHDDLCDSQLLNRLDDRYPFPKIICEVGFIHNMATYLTESLKIGQSFNSCSFG